jgi:hypothetical protein
LLTASRNVGIRCSEYQYNFTSGESVASPDPFACRETYRLVIVPKELEVTKRGRLFDDCVYFPYLTNESSQELPASEVVYGG